MTKKSEAKAPAPRDLTADDLRCAAGGARIVVPVKIKHNV